MIKPFAILRAEWRCLLYLNYTVDASLLLPYLPAGVELDLWEGQPLLSVVGLSLRGARVLGVPLPFHRRFEQINLRFYVRAGAGDDLRRGVVFIKEIVPRPLIARAARLLGENYHVLATGSTIEMQGEAVRPGGLIEYTFRTPRGWLGRRLNRLGGLAAGEPELPPPGSEAAFVTQREWSFTRRGARRALVMRAEHRPWRVRTVEQPYLLCDVAAAYGAQFEPYLRQRPRSALLADGSPAALLLGYPTIGQNHP